MLRIFFLLLLLVSTLKVAPAAKGEKKKNKVLDNILESNH